MLPQTGIDYWVGASSYLKTTFFFIDFLLLCYQSSETLLINFQSESTDRLVSFTKQCNLAVVYLFPEILTIYINIYNSI